MITYDLMLEKQRLLGADRFSLAANANETLCLRFNFDRHWRCFDSKAAVFRNAAGEYFIIEIIANRAKIPWEVLTHKGTFDVSVIGFDGIRTITSDTAELLVSENLLPEEYKTFSPSESLFDRFRAECTAEAYRKYEEEIKALKNTHLKEKLLLNAEINAADNRTKEAVRLKDEEIAQIRLEHTSVENGLNKQLADLNSQLDLYREKAEKWDMVDFAIQGKTVPSLPLWGGGKDDFVLPMLNTSSMPDFAPRNFGANLREIGLDLSSVTSFHSMFTNKNSIRRLTLRNTHNVTTFAYLASACTSIQYLDLGNISSCTDMTEMAMDATMLETVRFTDMTRISLIDLAFCGCTVLREIDGVFDFRTVTSAEEVFVNTPKLETIRFLENSITKDITFLQSVSLSRESLLSIANGLSAETPATVTLSNYAIEKAFPIPEEKAEYLSLIREEKGWTLVTG